jgi:hypothetical protein
MRRRQEGVKGEKDREMKGGESVEKNQVKEVRRIKSRRGES